jgi:hypothetical protein
VASLGRRDLLVATGKLDQLLQALARFSTRLEVAEAARDERFVARDAKDLGAGAGVRSAVAARKTVCPLWIHGGSPASPPVGRGGPDAPVHLRVSQPLELPP